MCGHVSRDDPPVYLTYTVAPALGAPQKDPTHTSNFGVKLQEHCRANGVPCELVYPGAPDVKNRECGNGVVVDHGDGWETQYCHMKRGTVRVRNGQQVAAGDALGDLGISGKAEFPHVHLSVRLNGEKLDPFTAEDMKQSCGLKPDQLWAGKPPYVGTGLAGAGFAGTAPKRYAAMMGDYDKNAFAAADGTLAYWATMFGVRTGDVVQFRLFGPRGEVLAQKSEPSPRDRGVAFDFVGIKPRSSVLAPGRYRAEFKLLRGTTIVAESSGEATVN